MFVYTAQDVIGLCILGFFAICGILLGIVWLIATIYEKLTDKEVKRDKRIF